MAKHTTIRATSIKMVYLNLWRSSFSTSYLYPPFKFPTLYPKMPRQQQTSKVEPKAWIYFLD